MRFYLLTICFFLVSCSPTTTKFSQPISPFVKFYEQSYDGILPTTNEVSFYIAENYELDDDSIDQLLTQGYQAIGCSSWIGPKQEIGNAAPHAKEIGATYVVYGYELESSNPRSYTNQYGQTTYSEGNRYNHQACFLIKENINKLVWGLYYVPLSAEEKSLYQTNRGLMIKTVVNNSPAFNANFIPGDIVLAIDEYQMIVVEDTLKVNKEKPTNIFKVLRRGSVIEITLKPTVYE